MRTFLALSLFFAVSFAHASEQCGTYSFVGTPRLLEDSIIVVINEGTLSEITLKVPSKEILRLAPYIGLMTSGHAVISNFIDSRIAEVTKISSLDPSMESSSINMMEKGDCR